MATRRCYSVPPGTANRTATTVRLAQRKWLSAELATFILEIVLREHLGYTVEIPSNTGIGAAWGKNMEDGIFDMEVESWRAKPEDPDSREFIDQKKVVERAGNGQLGYSGRASIWVNEGLQKAQPFSDFFRYWQDSSHFQAAGIVRYGDVDLASWLGAEFPICNVSTTDWCSKRYTGYWVPPQCEGDPRKCALMLHYNPFYDTGYFEQLVQNHRLMIVVAYAGSQAPVLAKLLVEQGKNVAFYWWEPDPLVTLVDAKPIAFPDYERGCATGNNKRPDGTTECDYPALNLRKLVRSALKTDAPEAYYAFNRYTLSMDDVTSMIKATSEGGGTMSRFEAACDFVKNRGAQMVAEIAPECISKPKAAPQAGDLVFDAALQKCQETAALPSFQTKCLEEIPGTVEARRTILLKLARRGWPSHDLASAVLQIVLKDYMRYSVYTSDVSGAKSTDWGPDMDKLLYDVDVESWQVDPDSAAYGEYVVGKAIVAKPENVGYYGRSSLFVLPHTLRKDRFADYWRFYLQERPSTSFYRFADLDAALLGPEFPQCNSTEYGWCGSGRLAGFFATPPCEAAPDNCIVVFMAETIWDTGFFEQLTKNLGMPLVFAYLGKARLRSLVKSVHQAAGKDLLFYWYEPDPLATETSASRVAFPDFSFGCDNGNTEDPRTGTVACDFPPKDLKKIVRARLASEAPEAFALLDSFSLTAEDMRAMLRDYTAMSAPDPQTVACSWVKANFARVQRDIAPDCIARPKKDEDIRVGDWAFNPALGGCQKVVCALDEILVVAGGSPVCQPCEKNQLPDQEQTRCLACAEGSSPRLQPSGVLQCTCNPGFKHVYRNGVSTCEICPAGTYADRPVQAQRCLNCTAGTFSAKPGSIACLACERGKLASRPGQEICDPCSAGSFMAGTGASACTSCGANHVTLIYGAESRSHCVCREHFFRLRPGSPCVPCPLGMNCPRGSDLSLFHSWHQAGRKPGDEVPAAIPMAMEGHMSLSERPLEVYACSSKEKCPGGPPGTCGRSLRQGVVACAHCEKRFFWDGAKCVKCTTFETSGWLFPTIPIFFCPIVVVVLYRISRDDTEKWGSWRNCMAAIGLLLLNHFQITSVVSQADFAYSDVLTLSMAVSYFTEDPIAVFRPQCAGITSFMDSIAIRALVPLGLLLMVVLCHICSHVVARLRAEEFVGFDRDRSMNIYFSMIFTFFAGLSSMALTTFKCAANPNGRSTLIADRSIHCYQTVWFEVVAIALGAVLQIAFFATLFCWATYIAPTRFGDPTFRRRWKFLFIKFRPDIWWWSLLLCARGVMANVGFIFMQSGFLQIYWVMAVMVAYTFFLVMFAPWRHMKANSMDVFGCFVMNALISLLAFHIVHVPTGDVSSLQHTVDVIAFLLILAPPVAGALLVFVAMRTQTHAGIKAAQEAELRVLYKSLKEFGALEEDQAVMAVNMIDDWGRWHILSSLRLIGAELIGLEEEVAWRLCDGSIRAAATIRHPSARVTGQGASGLPMVRVVV